MPDHHDHDHDDHDHHDHDHAPLRPIRLNFNDFLTFFPMIEPPVTLNEEDARAFSAHNEPLPGLMIHQFINAFEEEAEDEFTEYVACFQLPATDAYFALIYWKAELLQNGFFLATYTKAGHQLSRYRISGMSWEDDKLTQTVATIEVSMNIYIAHGNSNATRSSFEASSTRTELVTIEEDGTIFVG